MYYKCLKCRETFEEDELEVKEIIDYVPYGDTQVPMSSYSTFCPFCGEEDPDERFDDEEIEEDDEEGDE